MYCVNMCNIVSCPNCPMVSYLWSVFEVNISPFLFVESVWLIQNALALPCQRYLYVIVFFICNSSQATMGIVHP